MENDDYEKVIKMLRGESEGGSQKLSMREIIKRLVDSEEDKHKRSIYMVQRRRSCARDSEISSGSAYDMSEVDPIVA